MTTQNFNKRIGIVKSNNGNTVRIRPAGAEDYGEYVGKTYIGTYIIRHRSDDQTPEEFKAAYPVDAVLEIQPDE